MAIGEEREYPQEEYLAHGTAIVGTGRISAARRVTPTHRLPFRRSELAALDRALTTASVRTGLHFSVYLGELGTHPRARAEELVDSLGGLAPEAVLIAVSPGERVIEVVTGVAARQRVPDRDCKAAVTNMVAAFERGDLVGGLVDGLRTFIEQAESG